MAQNCMAGLSRRELVLGASAYSLGGTLLSGAALADDTAIRLFELRAAPGKAALRAPPSSITKLWTYNGSVPGPAIRARQHERLRIVVNNGLNEDTTVHWHGLRIPNSMDGVPHLTQVPIGSGDAFRYDFVVPDAGTYWYHPHQRSFEQVGRGLYGALIIEESDPPRVDRELTWVLDDWRLSKSGAISETFGNRHDAAHNGRVGNAVTVNGRLPGDVTLRRGERIRLRLINAANARIFGLEFQGHEPVVIALDGQPVAPHAPDGGVVVLGPGMRADLIIDAAAAGGDRFSVHDRFYTGLEYKLLDLAYDEEQLRQRTPDWPMELPANPLPEPDTAAAGRHEVSSRAA